MTATQKDIAARLGVSRSLVSRALRGTAVRIRAKPATVRRIRTEAERLGYRPSAAALALRGGATQTIAVLVKDFGDPFFGHILSELDRLARQRGFGLVMSGGGPGHAPEEVAALIGRYRPDGLLLVGSDFLPEAARERAAAGQRVVRLGSGAAVPGMGQVAMNEQTGMVRLLGYLRELGHRRVGYLAQPDPRSRRREQALREAAAQVGLQPPLTAPPARWRRCPRPWADLPRAWVAFDDVTAIDAMRHWSAAGVRIPGEVSVVGVDDIPAAALVTPALTTLRQPVRAIARRAFEQVMASEGPATVLITPDVTVRASCAPTRQTSQGGPDS